MGLLDDYDARSYRDEALSNDGVPLPHADRSDGLEPAEGRVKDGHGRDYTDVVPFQGVHAGAAEQTLEVGVTITRVS
jgi:hypothetical protein